MIIPNKVNPNGSGKPDKFTLPDISSTAYYILKFACMD